MQQHQLINLTYTELIKAGKESEKPKNHASGIRVAILADSATQHLTMALNALFNIKGFSADVYEAEYDSFEQEILNDESNLYAHKPDYVIFDCCTQAFEVKFANQKQENQLADKYLNRILGFHELINKKTNCQIIQFLLVPPFDGILGNQTVVENASILAQISRINNEFITRAAARKCLVLNLPQIASEIGYNKWFDERLWCSARQQFSPKYIPIVAKNCIDIILAQQGFGKKCVIVDLDNTLWGGILGEDGIENIQVGDTDLGAAFSHFQRFLLRLKNRGVILAICSKNKLENVENVLQNHPDMKLRLQDFAAIRANYDDKVSNIRQIQEELNIGFDSMVFFDDTPFEREFVRRNIPQIEVPDLPEDPAKFVSYVAGLNLFESQLQTPEDQVRSQYYQDNQKREKLKSSATSLDQFLKGLDMTASLSEFNNFSLPRAHQLIQRSNQFNLTTKRYSESQLAEIASSEDCDTVCMRLVDNLGDNGIIAIMIMKQIGSDMWIDTFVMSCRVLGRTVEEYFINLAIFRAKSRGLQRLLGQYIPTAKNQMVKDLFPKLGFYEIEEGALWALDISTARELNTFIETEQPEHAQH
jgi:FkbH-like protein